MLGSGLRKWAKELNFTIEKGTAYGEVEGFLVTLSEGMGNKNLAISFTAKGEGLVHIKELVEAIAKANNVLEVFYCDYGVIIYFTDNWGSTTIKVMKKALELLVEGLKANSANGTSTCLLCGQPLSFEGTEIININSINLKVHSSCKDMARETDESASKKNNWNEAAVEDLLEEGQIGKTVEKVEPKGNVGLGLVGAILGALVGAIPWAIAYYFGWFFGLFGLIIGFCSMKGYELFCNKVSYAKLFTVMISSFIVVCLVQFFGDCFILWNYQDAQMGEASLAEAGISFMDIVKLMFMMLREDAELLTEFIGNLGLGLLFAFFGLVDIIKQINLERKINKRMD